MSGAVEEEEFEWREGWSFCMTGFEMTHDEGVYDLTIEVSYVYVTGIAEGADQGVDGGALVAQDVVLGAVEGFGELPRQGEC